MYEAEEEEEVSFFFRYNVVYRRMNNKTLFELLYPNQLDTPNTTHRQNVFFSYSSFLNIIRTDSYNFL